MEARKRKEKLKHEKGFSIVNGSGKVNININLPAAKEKSPYSFGNLLRGVTSITSIYKIWENFFG